MQNKCVTGNAIITTMMLNHFYIFATPTLISKLTISSQSQWTDISNIQKYCQLSTHTHTHTRTHTHTHTRAQQVYVSLNFVRDNLG